MQTNIEIDGTAFLINGRCTYEGRMHRGKPINGLLFNSRMVQAIFDDANPFTADNWRYPDTGMWDAERNTREFCAALPTYKQHGLLGVTVGLQGGGSVYVPDIYERYLNSAFEINGVIKSEYLTRLLNVIRAADEVGMVVIVNYWYWKQAARMQSERVVTSVTERLTEWLLQTGYQNILVDVANEAADWWNQPQFGVERIDQLIDVVRGISHNGRRLLVGSSTGGGDALPVGRWQQIEDFHMPHGNGLTADELRNKLQRLKATDEFKRNPKPILVNEDSVFVENLEAAVDEYASWGFYHQGYGSAYRDRMDWTTQSRETSFTELSGFQTLPVNWGINDPYKCAFFDRVKEITGGSIA